MFVTVFELEGFLAMTEELEGFLAMTEELEGFLAFTEELEVLEANLIIYQALGDQVHEPGPRKPSRHFY
jgi:hypothetical protein